MKNGDVAMYQVATHLSKRALEKLNICMAYNPDEEIGSIYSKEKLDAIYVRDADDGDEDDDDESDFDSDDLLGSTLDTESGDAWIIDDDELGDDGYCDLLFVFADGKRVVLDDVDTTDYSYFVQVVADRDGADMDGE